MNTPIEKAIKILGSPAALARAAKVRPQAVSQWRSGDTKPSPGSSQLIENATDGEVTIADLRPDLAQFFTA
jgi:DNA-binding transcriptional regulator YdaS (Cro superfamily)